MSTHYFLFEEALPNFLAKYVEHEVSSPHFETFFNLDVWYKNKLKVICLNDSIDWRKDIVIVLTVQNAFDDGGLQIIFEDYFLILFFPFFKLPTQDNI